MANEEEKKLIPFPIFLILVSCGTFSVLMALDLLTLNEQEREMLKKLIFNGLIFVALYILFASVKSGIKDKLSGIRYKRAVSQGKVPDGYTCKIAEKEGFSFSYPENWVLTLPSDPMLYKEAKEVFLAQGLHSLRNFNISCQDISKIKDLEYLFNAIINGVLNVLQGARLEFKELLKLENVSGMRYKINYHNANGLNFCCYQAALTDNSKKILLILTFTCESRDFAGSRELFDQITGLVKIFS
ncbi:MAG: hypothetical protein HY810_03790 [Candidatus Omnitrophica bacterium]|nr:hypothetical protein [Candidatus Omnitrophota bacterium]